MATVVLDSKDLVKSLETGTTIEPADVIADRKGPAAAREAAKEKPAEAAASKETTAVESTTEPAADDVEGPDGLTPRQKREFTQAMQKSIARKHRQLKEAEEFAAAQYNDKRLAEQRLGALEAELAKLKAKPAEQPKAPKRPTRDKFESDGAYQDALVSFLVQEQLAKEKREAAEAVGKLEQAKMLETIGERITRARELVSDFDEVTSASNINVPPHIGQYLQDSEKIAELGYFFAKNPKELERLAAMPARNFAEAHRVGVELDKISAKLKPFAPTQAAEKSEAKASNGATPSQETESGSETAASQKSAGPNIPTESGRQAAGPSKPRSSAAVITPISGVSEAQVEGSAGLSKPREVIAKWAERNSPNLQRRKRH